jgi:hypothetical protein
MMASFGATTPTANASLNRVTLMVAEVACPAEMTTALVTSAV